MIRFLKLLVFVNILLLFSCNSNKESKSTDTALVKAHEHKLLLNNSKFENIDKAFSEFWEVVKAVADQQGIKVKESDDKFEQTHRQVEFYDTEDLGLNMKGYLIRKRTDYKGDELGSKFKLTIKFKDEDYSTVANVTLPLGEEYSSKEKELEVEADMINGETSESEPRISYAVSSSVKLKEISGNTVADYSKVFSSLKSLNIDQSKELVKVNGREAESFKVSPGVLDFGSGIEAECDITVWIIDGKIIPEFSFDHSLDDWKNKSENNVEKCESFINQLQKEAPEWFVNGKSKSSFIFN
ncbi:MAG: hypothetical protein ABFS12_06680 [Bacteroidota bacterium]